MGRQPTRVMRAGAAADGAELSEYERERLANIKRNQEMMESLGVAQAREEVAIVPSPAYAIFAFRVFFQSS